MEEWRVEVVEDEVQRMRCRSAEDAEDVEWDGSIMQAGTTDFCGSPAKPRTA